MQSDNISLFWYSLSKMRKPAKLFSGRFLRNKLQIEKENYGDLLSKYITKKVCNRNLNWYNPRTQKASENLFVIGSILNYCNEKTIVWGSGIIDNHHSIKAADFRAVRGPLTRKRLQKLGYYCPEIYGDPALLLPRFYFPRVKKKFTIGIVPHFFDYSKVKKLYGEISGIRIINLLTNDIEKTTDEILSCEKIISSSLHGIIVAHAYQIPAVWVKFSNNLHGDDVKFEDYFLSVQLESYKGVMIDKELPIDDLYKILKPKISLPSGSTISEVCENLIQCCPFSPEKINFRKIGKQNY